MSIRTHDHQIGRPAGRATDCSWPNCHEPAGYAVTQEVRRGGAYAPHWTRERKMYCRTHAVRWAARRALSLLEG